MPDEEHPVDPFHKLLADIDQAIAVSGELARYQKGLYDAYIEAGFTEKQALYMASEHMKPSGPRDV
jgi:hypothetical protein